MSDRQADGFVEAGELSTFREGRGRRVNVDGIDVAVFRIGDRFHAIQDACPHMGASLADGKVIDDCVECHWHHWMFDLRTGQGDQRSWARAAVFETMVDDGRLWLRRPGAGAPPPAEEEPAEEEEEWIRWDPDRFFKKK